MKRFINYATEESHGLCVVTRVEEDPACVKILLDFAKNGRVIFGVDKKLVCIRVISDLTFHSDTTTRFIFSMSTSDPLNVIFGNQDGSERVEILLRVTMNGMVVMAVGKKFIEVTVIDPISSTEVAVGDLKVLRLE